MRWLRCGAGALVLAAGVAEAAPAPTLDLALEVASEHRSVDPDRVRKHIATIADHYRRRARGASTVEAKCRALAAALFQDAKLKVVPTLERADALHIDAVLERRRGYCLSLSLIALCVAERVGLPLHGVVIPNHFFVRYDDGIVRRNIELTRNGARLDDNAMRKSLALPSGSLYLRNLTRQQLRACLLHNRGFVAMAAGQHKPARTDLLAAIQLAPGLGEAHRNLGVLEGEAKRWRPAAARFEEAIRRHARDWEAWAGLAVCRERLDDSAGARKAWRRLASGRPDDARARRALARPDGYRVGLRGRYYAGTNHDRLATERIDKAIDFDWKNASPAPGVPRDQFSVRWDGWFQAPRDGTYTFFVVANDGLRLEVAGNKLLDDWVDRRYENAFESAEIELKAGLHRIRIEHADHRGGARMLIRIAVEGTDDPLPHDTCLFHKRAKK